MCSAHSTAYHSSGAKYEVLFTADQDDVGPPSQDERQGRSHTPRCWWKIFAILELGFIMAFSLLQGFYYYTKTPSSLLGSVVRYEQRVFNTGYDEDVTAYAAPPSAEVDALWDNLIKGTVFKITEKEEKMLANRTSPVPGDKGYYLSSLSVVHHLHCLNNFRKSMWPEHYPTFDIHSNGYLFSHQVHCIDLLRQAHMCNPDLTPSVFQWDTIHHELIGPPDKQHTCVDFGAIQEWMRKRRVEDKQINKYAYVEGVPIYRPSFHNRYNAAH